MSHKKLQRYSRYLTILMVIVALFAAAWIANAFRVDCNGVSYAVEVSHAADFHHDIGDRGDAIQAERLEMQNSSNAVLAFAARLPFWGRLLITMVLVGIIVVLFQTTRVLLKLL